MNRREILKYTALATGAIVSLPLASSLLSSCKADIVENDTDYQTLFFNKEELSLVRKLVDLILPKTDSPSASDVNVHQIIDQFIGKVYDEEAQVDYRTNFDALSAYLKEGEQDFLKQSSEVQLQKLKDLIASQDTESAKAGFTTLKQQSVAYYLSTEEIATTYLNYLPVPGKYQACISLEEAGGKAWAL